MIEQIISRKMLQETGSLFYFYRTLAGAEIDLIIERGAERIGYEFKCSVSIGKRDWANLRAGIDEGVIHRGGKKPSARAFSTASRRVATLSFR